jgi:5-methylcytosine-specific restriction enzyme subunit McrC
MPRPLTLFEHECHTFAWTDRDLALLERLHASTHTDILKATIRNGKRAIQAMQHVGVVRFGNRTIQVLPKIYQARDAESEEIKTKQATANLLRMLAYASELPVREYELAPLMRQTDNWFEILTRLFATHLREEWQRGAYRTYRTVEDNCQVLKGKWRIAQQLKKPERKHLVFVAYDEFSADNRLNRVFRFVVERLWKLTRDYDNRQMLGELRQWMEEVTLVPNVTAQTANPSQLTRLNERYRPLLNLARVFLDGGALQMAVGDLTTFAFVFDMNQLFEKFITGFVHRHSLDILSDELKACDFLPQSRGASRYLAKRDEKTVFQTKPDIAFRNGEHFPLLVDTKYKRLDERDRKLGVSQADFYQMHAYAHRYACSRVLLLYPQTAGSSGATRACFKLEECPHTVEVSTVNLNANLNSKGDRQKLIAELRLSFSQEKNDHALQQSSISEVSR